jgi:uncharacterized repeat protein (TIGR02543 family)
MLTATPAPNYTFNGWGGDLTSAANPLPILIRSNMTVMAIFTPVVYSDGFESGNLLQLPWATGGNVPWFVTNQASAVGQWSARSGLMTDNQTSFQTSSLILATNFQAGNFSFDYRVSSEPLYDYLRFSLDGVEMQRWSGEVGWATFVLPLTAGSHTLQWDYVKDPTLSTGLDAAFIDNINLPSTPAVLQVIRLPDGSLLLEIQGQADREYQIQASSNLSSWTTIATEVAVGGVIQFTDPDVTSNPVRYYRAVAVVP